MFQVSDEAATKVRVESDSINQSTDAAKTDLVEDNEETNGKDDGGNSHVRHFHFLDLFTSVVQET